MGKTYPLSDFGPLSFHGHDLIQDASEYAFKEEHWRILPSPLIKKTIPNTKLHTIKIHFYLDLMY